MARSLTPLSARNQRVVRLGKLSARRRAREAEGVFVVDGPTLLAEALDADVGVEEVFVDVTRMDGALASLVDRAEATGARVFGVDAAVLRRVSDPVHPQAVTAIARHDAGEVGALQRTDAILGLVGLTDPGNAGTLIRSAVAAGFGAILTTPGTVEVFGPKALRASAGAAFHVPVVAVESPAAVAATHTTVATTLEATTAYDAVDLTGPVAVLVGNEAHGLDPSVAGSAALAVRIPMVGPTESLNAAMAGTVLCFEVLRQRRQEAA